MTTHPQTAVASSCSTTPRSRRSTTPTTTRSAGCTTGSSTTPSATACSTSPTAPSTARSGRCCWRPPPTAWCGWPSTARTTTPCSPSWPTEISPRILRAPRRLDDAARQLDEYFAGRRRTFDVPVDLQLAHGFRRDGARAPARHRLRPTPRATPRSPGAAGNPAAVRAVGSACAHNPVPLVVPCHRVVRSDGTIGQYLGGAEAKRRCWPWRRRHDRATTIADAGRRLGSTGSTGPASPPSSTTSACAVAGPVLSAGRVPSAVAALYDDDERFRSTIDMARHRFGEGQYRYFAHPLPDLVAELRAAFWPHLLPIARDWARAAGPAGALARRVRRVARRVPRRRPDDARRRCMLRYGPGDWNALHRDLYGELVFPLQVVIGLDAARTSTTPAASSWSSSSGPAPSPGPRRPRSARATALVFTTRDRPVRSARGWSAAPMRHGVSVVRSGRRHTLGLVFHDAT